MNMMKYLTDHTIIVCHECGGCNWPVMLQSRRKVGVSPLYWLIIPRAAAWGTGIVKVMGLWNFLRRGSTVTIGDTATRLPNSFTTSSVPIGWAYTSINLSQSTHELTHFSLLFFLIASSRAMYFLALVFIA